MSLLLALDLNDPTTELLAQAFTWAERLSTPLDLVYVDQYPYTIQDPVVQSMLTADWRKGHEERQARLTELLSAAPAHLRGTSSVRLGRAADEIVAAGAGHDAILIATHGRRGLSHVLLGSVAERVVRSSTVPVVVLPPAATVER